MQADHRVRFLRNIGQHLLDFIGQWGKLFEHLARSADYLFRCLGAARAGAAAIGQHRHHVTGRARRCKQRDPVLLLLPVADVLAGSCFNLVVAHAFGLD